MKYVLAAVLVAGLSHHASAQLGDPIYERAVGAWSIGGYVSKTGNTIVCRLTRLASDGSPFGYVFGLGAGGDNVVVKVWFTVPADLPDGTPIRLFMDFGRGAPVALDGGVDGGLVHAELPSDPSAMKRILDRFQGSKSMNLKVTSNGSTVRAQQIDLASSAKAFDENGICASMMMQVGVERMKNTHPAE